MIGTLFIVGKGTGLIELLAVIPGLTSQVISFYLIGGVMGTIGGFLGG